MACKALICLSFLAKAPLFAAHDCRDLYIVLEIKALGLYREPIGRIAVQALLTARRYAVDLVPRRAIFSGRLGRIRGNDENGHIFCIGFDDRECAVQ